MRKKGKLILILLFSSFLVLHFYLPRFVTEIKNPILSSLRKPSENKSFSTTKDIYSIQSFDGITLSFNISRTTCKNEKGTIILLHGIRSSKEHFNELSNYLSEQGFNAVALDLRAHGQSSGTHCTFGVKEKKDLSILMDYLLNQTKVHSNIGVWGQSLGGAVGLHALSYDSRIKFGIIESTFSEFDKITADYFNYHVGFHLPYITHYLTYRAGKIAEFSPEEASPVRHCHKIHQPLLMAHGTADKRIAIEYARQNFHHLSSKQKKFIAIDGANHVNVWKIGGSAYFDEVAHFLQQFADNSIL